jgi:hypothetical protein
MRDKSHRLEGPQKTQPIATIFSCKRGESETTTEKAGGHEKEKTHNEEKERVYLYLFGHRNNSLQVSCNANLWALANRPIFEQRKKNKTKSLAICGDSLEAASNGRVPVDASLMLLGSRGQIFHQSFRLIELSACVRVMP